MLERFLPFDNLNLPFFSYSLPEALTPVVRGGRPRQSTDCPGPTHLPRLVNRQADPRRSYTRPPLKRGRVVWPVDQNCP